MYTKDSPEIAKGFFDLGWEYFAAKQGIPTDANVPQSFLNGYEEAKTRIKPVRGDRYELKLLQIKYGALKRNRIFDETVTAEVLHRIDVTHCPVTLAPLTHSTFSDSDWSIDRVSNNLGYSLGNLVVVSTKANKAKGSMSYQEIYQAAESTDNTNGLTPFEWQRWRAICAFNGNAINENGYSLGYFCAPYVVECPAMMVMNPSAALQHAISRKAYGHRELTMYDTLLAGLGKSIRKQFNCVINEAIKLKNTVRYNESEIWFNKRLFNKFLDIFMQLKKEELRLISVNIDKYNHTTDYINMATPAWNPKLKGYNL